MYVAKQWVQRAEFIFSLPEFDDCDCLTLLGQKRERGYLVCLEMNEKLRKNGDFYSLIILTSHEWIHMEVAQMVLKGNFLHGVHFNIIKVAAVLNLACKKKLDMKWYPWINFFWPLQVLGFSSQSFYVYVPLITLFNQQFFYSKISTDTDFCHLLLFQLETMHWLMNEASSSSL